MSDDIEKLKAEIDRLHDQIGDWIVQTDEANARADRMEKAVVRYLTAATAYSVSGNLKNLREMMQADLALRSIVFPEAFSDKPAALSPVATDQGEGKP